MTHPFFLEAATIAAYGLTSMGLVWVVWRCVVWSKGKKYIWYPYEEEDLHDEP